MVNYTFAPQAAVDISTARLVAQEGLSGSLYPTEADAEAGTGALTVTVAGGLTSTTISASAFGQLPEFTVADHYQVWWKSGAYIVHLMSFDGLLEAAEAYATASVAAQAAAEQALTQLQAIIDAGGGVGGGGGGVSDHGALAGLADDDHTQYLTSTRALAQFYSRAQVDTLANNAALQNSAADRARGNHTGTQAIASILGLQAALDSLANASAGPDVVRVMIATSNTTARPSGAVCVLWLDARSDKTNPPDNVGDNDIWWPEIGTAGADLTAPTTPTTLTKTSITASSFTLGWAASTDAVGVTGYEVQRDGSVSLGVAAGTTRNVTGLSQNTSYTFRVRARDAAGNVSPWSDPIEVTTATSSDSVPPTVPTGLGATGITSSGFTLTWGAGTDNVGISGYDVRLNGGAPVTVAAEPRSRAFTGLSASTAYTAEVRSRDAAGNTSAYVAFNVNTLAPAGDTYSVYGSGAPTGTWVFGTDGTPYIVFSRGFLCSAAGARVVGGRVWIPTAAVGAVPTEVTFTLFGPDADIGSTVVQTKVVSSAGATAGSWVEAMFDTPQGMDTGENWVIGVRFTGAGDAGKYVYAPDARPNNDPIVSSGPLGADLAWAGSSDGTQATAYKIGTGSVTAPGSGTQSYGVDILVDTEG